MDPKICFLTWAISLLDAVYSKKRFDIMLGKHWKLHWSWLNKQCLNSVLKIRRTFLPFVWTAVRVSFYAITTPCPSGVNTFYFNPTIALFIWNVGHVCPSWWRWQCHSLSTGSTCSPANKQNHINQWASVLV